MVSFQFPFVGTFTFHYCAYCVGTEASVPFPSRFVGTPSPSVALRRYTSLSLCLVGTLCHRTVSSFFFRCMSFPLCTAHVYPSHGASISTRRHGVSVGMPPLGPDRYTFHRSAPVHTLSIVRTASVQVPPPLCFVGTPSCVLPSYERPLHCTAVSAHLPCCIASAKIGRY